jgi:hypothetical protein
MGAVPNGSHIHRINDSTVYSKETCQWISEHEHIGLHNIERGWGARLTRTELIDRCAALQQQLAAERETKEKAIEAWSNRNLKLAEQLAEREKVKVLVEILEAIADREQIRSAVDMANLAKHALAKEALKEIERLQEESPRF